MKIKDSQVSRNHEKTWGFHPKLGKTKEICSISFIKIFLQDSLKIHQTYINTAFLYNFRHTLLLHHIPAIPQLIPIFQIYEPKLGKIHMHGYLKKPETPRNMVFPSFWNLGRNLGIPSKLGKIPELQLLYNKKAAWYYRFLLPYNRLFVL